MSAFAKWLEANRALRIVLVAITFPLPLANVLSGAILVLVARNSGLRLAALDAAAAALLLAVMLALTGGPWQSGLGGALALWGGAVLGGHLLGRFGSVDLAVQALLGATLAGVLLAGVLVADPRSYWQPILEKLFATAGVPKVEELPADWLGTVAELMHGIIGASVLSSILLGLVIGTWLGGGPEIGAWRQRFLELRLGRVLSAIAAVALLGLSAGFTNPAGGVALVLGTGFVAQGLAVVHWTADRRGWPRVWPLALYGPLLLSAPVAGLLLLALALAGFVDNFLGLRRARSNVV
jgi:hypothetical protein